MNRKGLPRRCPEHNTPTLSAYRMDDGIYVREYRKCLCERWYDPRTREYLAAVPFGLLPNPREDL